MILPQVHLPKPCYESLPLKGIAFLETAQSRTATGDIYKGQGRNQRELMIHIS
uniref:Uncharacterized protein n=1 Tax=Wuchereria bancrofti TaxID=6293 RepID=A0AAF5PTW3_WUCBA